MAVNFKGGLADRKGKPFAETIHPLSSDEIRYLLEILKRASFTGEEMEHLIIITMKLQEEYQKVSDNEEEEKNK